MSINDNNITEDITVASNVANPIMPVGTKKSELKDPLTYKDANKKKSIKTLKEWLESYK